MYMQQYKLWLAGGKKIHSSTISVAMHLNCRGGSYPRTDSKVVRCKVPDENVEWKEPYPEYSPTQYTASHILAGPAYADPLLGNAVGLSDGLVPLVLLDRSPGFKPKWNTIDGSINRCSHEGTYPIVEGLPRNLHGRTGVCGRGALGRWGPNHAADPIVTRWKMKCGQRVLHEETKQPVLQFVCIQRRDGGGWAIPGGMVDAGEKVSTTLQREFFEEALNSLEMTPGQKKLAEEQLKQLFQGGDEIYSGYVDDRRNTDNAWMETVAYNFHETQVDGILHRLQLQAGDDAQAVKWQDVSSQLDLYANHKDFIKKVAEKLNAHW